MSLIKRARDGFIRSVLVIGLFLFLFVTLWIDVVWLIYHLGRCEIIAGEWEWDKSNGYGRCSVCGMHRPHPGGF